MMLQIFTFFRENGVLICAILLALIYLLTYIIAERRDRCERCGAKFDRPKGSGQSLIWVCKNGHVKHG
jgi:hypothetical protein